MVATVVAAIVCKLNPTIISAVAIPFVTLATVTLACRSVRRHGDRGPSGDENGTV